MNKKIRDWYCKRGLFIFLENKERGYKYMTEYKLLFHKLDIVFQRLFGKIGSEKITKRFIEKINLESK